VRAQEAVEDPLRGRTGEHLADGRPESGRVTEERLPGEGPEAGDGAVGERGYFATSTQRNPRKSPS
jgi:hypothetical protein